MLLGRLPPRPQEIVPRRMELPANFSDECKKIGSKRTKFEDLGLPIPKPKMVIVTEYDSSEKGPPIKQKTFEPIHKSHKVRIVVHTPCAVIYSGEQQEGAEQPYEL